MEEGRAYSALAVKDFREDQRGYSFAGLATSPVADRVSDRIDPLGAKYKNPCVLLRAHDHLTPIGQCTFGRPTKSGITFEAKIPKISEPGLLKDRLDMAAGEVAQGLMRGVSIGFRPTKPPVPNELGGLDYPSTEIFELSTCAVPMHQLATIEQIKAVDAAVLRGEAPILTTNASRDDDGYSPWALKFVTEHIEELRRIRRANSKAVLYTQGQHDMIAEGFGSAFASVALLNDRIKELEDRLDKPALAYAGVYQRALDYRRGQAVTYKGSLYIALEAAEPGQIPGESAPWQLAVRAGRDGKDAR